MKITLQNNKFDLNFLGGIYWFEQKTLLVADVHLGKSAHFRKNGSAIPSFTDVENYKSLDLLLRMYEVDELIFLGDLFHSVYNSSWDAFSDWIKRQSCTFRLVVGNHDVIAPVHFEKLGIKTHQKLEINPFSFTHHPVTQPELFNFCGHLHPGYQLRGDGKQLLKLPCFYKQKNQLILPAFGKFTGHFYVKPEPGEQVFVVAEDEVLEV